MNKCYRASSFFLLLFFHFLSMNTLIAQCGAGQTLFTGCYANNEVNVVLIEICPTAGMAAQATILAGSFDTSDNLTVYQGTSGSGTAGTIYLGPQSGNLAGTIITGSTADECLIFVSNSNFVLSCDDGFESELQVCGESIVAGSVQMTLPNDFCVDDGIQSGLNGGLPNGGVYSGPGVTDDGNGMTFSFNPATATVGTHTLTYTFSATPATDDLEVFAVPTVNFTAPNDLCIDAGIQTGLGGGTPTGGIYSGPGVTDDGNGTTYSFNPGIAGLGMHTITYTEGTVCAVTSTDDIDVLSACGCPVGQTSYFNCYDNNETDLVIFEVCPSAGMAAQATIDQGTYASFLDNLTVYQGLSGSGTSGTIVFGPMGGDLSGNTITGNLADNCLIFVNNTEFIFSCMDGDGIALSVCGESISTSVVYTALGDLCVDEGVQTGLGSGSPTGGVYSGSGVTDDGNGTTYSFDPAAAGVGIHTLTYMLGGNSAMDDVEVLAVPTPSYTAPVDLCIDAGKQNNLGGASPTGGVYSGPGITDDGNGLTYSFDPAAAGLGTHTITYTEGNCSVTATDDIEVLAACSCPLGEVSYFHCYDNSETNLVLFEVCPSAGMYAQADINQGTYATGDQLTIYQGTTGSGTGGSIVFGPLNGNFSGNSILSSVADECLIFVSNSNPVISCTDGFETSLMVCGTSNTSNVTFTALDDLSANADIQTGLSGGAPTGGAYSGPGVTDDGNGMTYTFNPATAGVGVHTLTYTVGGGSATDDVEVLNLLPPGFSKFFNPTTIGIGSVTTLTFTIDNSASGTPLSSLDFTDNLPAGMTVASPANINHTCFSGTVTAVEGGSTISFTGGELTGSGTCTISVNVTSSTAGVHTNTTGDLTSSAGNSGTASSNLTVDASCPIFSKSFSPSTINMGERSTLTFTIDNTAGAIDLRSVTFSDNLPAGMVVASPSNATSTCLNGTITAVPGTDVISYAPTVFGQISVSVGTSCSVSVDVIATNSGMLDNTTGNFSFLNNLFQTINCGYANASLEVVTPAEILIQKSFTTNPVLPGGTTNLEYTVTNLSRDFEATNITFTEDLTSVLSGLTATGTPLSNGCGTGSLLSGTTMLTFTGGTIAAGATCTFSVPLQVPGGAASGTYTSTSGTISGDFNGSTITGNTATEYLTVANVPTITKTFLDNPIPAGGTTTVEFTITNTSSTTAITDLAFTDNVTDFIGGTTISNLPAAGACGAGSTFFNNIVFDELIFQMTGGNLAAGASCTFTVDLTIPDGISSGTYTNTTSDISGTVDAQSVIGAAASDDLTLLALPQLTKSFTNDPVEAGAIVNLEFTLIYDEFASGDATSLGFTDDLNAVIPGLAAIGLPMNNICGTGSQISGTTNLTFTGGSLSPGDTCTFVIPVQVPVGTTPGTYTNTTSTLSVTVGGQSAVGGAATDDLLIGGLSLTKEFIGDPAIPGELITLRYTIDNTTTFDATNVVFTDNLNGALPFLAAEIPLPVAPCATAMVSGTTFFVFVGGTVSAGTTCTFDLPVRVPSGAASGTYGSTTSNMSATLNGASLSLPTATDDLVVDATKIELTKSFTDDPVIPGATVTLEYTLTNLDASNAVSDIAFTDNFDAILSGLAATNLPLTNICGAGSTASGTSTLSFTGGNLAAGASCTFSVTLQVPLAAVYGSSYTSTSSTLTGTLNGLAIVGDAASDDLKIQSLQFTKSIAGPVLPGESTTITYTITNSDPVNTITDIVFTNDLDAFISGMTATNLPLDNVCGTGSRVSGTSIVTLGRGELAAGQSCNFDVTVLVPCGTTSATYTNTTSQMTGLGVNGGVTTEAASDDLLVNAVTVALTAPSDVCVDGAVQNSLMGGTPVQGTEVGDVGLYSGPGVTDDGNGMTYSFDPSGAGAGVHTITYTYTDGKGCVYTGTDMIEVFALPVVAFTAPGDLCIDAGLQNGLGSGTPAQGSLIGDAGIYSGPGVTDDGNGMTYSFDPTTAGAGIHTLTYSYTDDKGCSNSASDLIEVIAIPAAPVTTGETITVGNAVVTGLTATADDCITTAAVSGTTTVTLTTMELPSINFSFASPMTATFDMLAAGIPAGAIVKDADMDGFAITITAVTGNSFVVCTGSEGVDATLTAQGPDMTASYVNTGKNNSTGPWSIGGTLSAAFDGENASGDWIFNFTDTYDDPSDCGGSGPENEITSSISLTVEWEVPAVTTPATISWWTASTGGTQQGTGSPLDPTGLTAEEGAVDLNAIGDYTFYAESGCACADRTAGVLSVIAVVPLELLSFEGRQNGSTNILEWTTANEVNTSHFIVERSRNGIDFEAIGPSIVAAENSVVEKKYSLIDRQPLLAANYYRLKMIDLDGSFAYSNTVSILSSPLPNGELALIPIPARDQAILSFVSAYRESAMFIVRDLLGRIVLQQNIVMKIGQNSQEVDLSSLPAGVYLIQVNSLQFDQPLKIVKE